MSKDLKWHFKYIVSQGHMTLMLEKDQQRATHHSLSKCTKASVQSVFYAALLSRRWALDCLQTRPAETWYFMFLEAEFSPSQLPRGGDTAELRRVQSRDKRTGAHNFTCLPFEPLARPPAAILHFTNNCSHICGAADEKKTRTPVLDVS